MSDLQKQKVLLIADLNVGASLREINKRITAIERSSQLKALRLKIDIRHIGQIGAVIKNMQQLNRQIATVKNGIQEADEKSGTFLKRLLGTPDWVVTSVFALASSAAMATLDSILQVDRQITELKRTMNSDTNFERLLQGSITLSSELGRTLADTNAVMTEYARQGVSEEQLLGLTKTALLAQNISDLTPDATLQALTQAMTVFGMQADQSLGVLDKLVAVDNGFAASSQNLALGFQQSAAAAQQFGVSLDQNLGDLAAIMETTRQSGDQAGDALGTIYARLTTLEPSIETLAQLGINVHNSQGELKSATEILDELAVAFQNVNEQTKHNAAVTLAGRDHMSSFLALIGNRNVAHSATARALQAEGSAMRENETYMQSFEARINEMRNAWQQFALAMGEAGLNNAIISLLNSLTTLAGYLKNVVHAFGLFPTVLGVFAGAAYLARTALSAFIVNITGAIAAQFGLQTANMAAARSFGILTTATRVFSVSLKALLASTGVGLIFVAIGTAIEGLIHWFGKGKDAGTDFFYTLKEDIRSTTEEIDRLQALQQRMHLSTSSEEELNSVYAELAKTIPGVISHFDAEGKAVYKNKAAIDELIKSEQALHNLKLKNQMFDAKSNLDAVVAEIESNQALKKETASISNKLLAQEQANKHIREYGDTYGFGNNSAEEKQRLSNFKNELQSIYQNYNLDIPKYTDNNFAISSNYNVLSDRSFERIKENLQNNQNTINQATENIKTATRQFNEYLSGLGAISYNELGINDPNIKLLFEQIASQMTEGVELSSDNKDNILASYETLTQDIGSYLQENPIDFSNGIDEQSLEKLKKAFPDAAELFDGLIQKAGEAKDQFAGTFDVLDENGNKLGTFKNTAEAAAKGITVLKDSMSISSTGIVTYQGTVEDLDAALKKLSDESTAVLGRIDALGSAYQTLANGEALSLSTLLKLVDEHPALAEHLKTNNDLTFNKGELLKQVAEIEKNNLILSKTNALEELNTTKNTLTAKIKAYQSYYKGISPIFQQSLPKSPEELMNSPERFRVPSVSELTQTFANATSSPPETPTAEDFNKLAQINEQISQTEAAIIAINSIPLDEFNLRPPNNVKAGPSSPPEDAPELRDITDAAINRIHKAANEQARHNDELERTLSNSTSLANKLSLTNELYTGQREEIRLLQNANLALWTERDKIEQSAPDHNMRSWVDANGEATASFITLYNSMKSSSAQKELQGLYDRYHVYTMAIRSNREEIKGLTQENAQLLQSQKTLREENTRSWLEKNANALNSYQEQITASERRQLRYTTEGSSEWLAEEEKKNDARKRWQEELHRLNTMYRDRIAASASGREEDKLTEAQLADLRAEIARNANAWWDLEQSIIGTSKSMNDARARAADHVLADYKRMLEKQRSLELDLLEQSMKAEDDRHRQVMDNYDEELRKFSEFINNQLQAFSRENDSDDFNREMQKLRDKEIKLRQQLILVGMDDSFEGKAKKKEIEEELANIQQDVEEKQRNRNRTLRVESLQDQMKDFEQHIAQVKRLETDDYEWNKKELEAEKTRIENHYKSIFDNELYWSGLKNQLMSDDVTKVQQTLQTIRGNYIAFFEFLKSNAPRLSELLGTDLLAMTEQNMQEEYENINMPSSHSSNSSSNSKPAVDPVFAAWNEYLANKQKAEAMGANKGSAFQELAARNQKLREQYGFQDKSFNQLKNSPSPVFNAKSGGMTPAWGGSDKFLLAHEKELILNKSDTSNMLKMIDIARSAIQGIQSTNFNRLLKTNTSPAPSTYHINLHIDKVNGDLNGANTVFNTVIKGIKKLGGGG